MAYLYFLTICLIWGSSFILMKKAALVFTGAEIAAGRALGGALVLVAAWWWTRSRWVVRRNDWWALLGVVLIGYVWPWALQPSLIRRYGSGFIGLTVGFTPLLTVLVSVPMLRAWPTRRQLIGVVGALGCLALLMIDGLKRSIPPTQLLLAGTIPAGYAVANTWIRRSLRQMPALELSLASMLLTTLFLLPFVRHHADIFTSRTEGVPLAVAAMLLLGIVGTGLAMFLFNKLIHEQGPLFAGMVTNLVPVGAVLWGWADHERVTPLQIIALVGLLVMVAIVQFGAATRSSDTA